MVTTGSQAGSKAAPLAARYRSLDHWRGFAALWVLIFHSYNLWLQVQPGLLPAWLGNFISHGWLGVQVFFVISGYCITERAAREYRENGTATRFMADRLLRIYPPFWVALAFALLLNTASALVRHQPVAGLIPVGWEWASAAAATAHWLGQPTFLLVAWTLSYEIGFYILSAIGLALALRSRRPWLGFCWGLGLLLLGILIPGGLGLPLIVSWPNFALGGVVWLVQHRIGSIQPRLLLGTLLMGAIFATGLWLTSSQNSNFAFACGCAWLLMALQPWDRSIADWPALRWLGWVGTFSYSIYLIHAPIISRAFNLIGRWHAAAGIRALLLQSFACLVTVAVAWLFYQLVEVRCEVIRRTLIKQLKPRSS